MSKQPINDCINNVSNGFEKISQHAESYFPAGHPLHMQMEFVHAMVNSMNDQKSVSNEQLKMVFDFV